MTYLSVCSGIEAATVAWHPLGWTPIAFSEIEPFPSAVLAHHYPNVPNLGDMTKYKEWNIERPDVLVGGTPCQSFSVAGLRRGLEDPRGNLMLVFLGIADRCKPTWVVWENVPGVLSSSKGRDFGSFLGGLGELGYGWAYRVLDAQYFGVAQRRRRVFVVGYLGDWRRAAEVLFELDSLSGNPAPSREAGQVAPTLSSSGAGVERTGNERTEAEFLVMSSGQANAEVVKDISTFLTWLREAPILAHSLRARANASHREDSDTYIAHTLTKKYDSSEDGTGRGTPLVVDARQDPNTCEDFSPPIGRKDTGHAVAIRTAQTSANGHGVADEVAHTLDRAQGQAIVFDETQVTSQANRSNPQPGDPSHPLAAGARPPTLAYSIQERAVSTNLKAGPGGSGINSELAFTLEARNKVQAVGGSMAVRRLTPRECERLQGFPDDYTLIPWRCDLKAWAQNKTCPDGPRYKALGNSMAVPVMAWIGRRIDMIAREEAPK